MTGRNYYVVSLKHLYPWKYGEPLCLWGVKQTKDDEERCYGGYTEKLDHAELYSMGEFLKHYACCTYKEEVNILPTLFKSLKKNYDCVFVKKEVLERYYMECGLIPKAEISQDEKDKLIEQLKKEKDEAIKDAEFWKTKYQNLHNVLNSPSEDLGSEV